MNTRNTIVLRTPQGTEGFGEAGQHQRLLRLVEDHLSLWGYLPALTPMLDFFEAYRPLLDENQVSRSYRFPDRNGELLMLRSDITLFLAKHIGITLNDGVLPRRIYYADSIIRHEKNEEISNEEYFQTGAELIGRAGINGDLEVLMLLHDLLDSMELPLWRLHLGSRRLLDALLQGRVDPDRAGALLEIRDRRGLETLFAEAGLSQSTGRSEILFFLGTLSEFHAFLDSLPGIDDAVEGALEELIRLTRSLTKLVQPDRFRVDLSEHGGQPYYTGFTVRAYVEGANNAVASGGRYDQLLGAFGFPAPAAGFSLMLRKIEALSSYASRDSDAPRRTLHGADFVKSHLKAQRLRKDGETVILDLEESGG